MFELFEHTADVGLRIRAADLNGLFAEAARGLFSLIVENMDDVRPGRQRTFCLEADNPTELLCDWLAELLFVFDTKHLLFVEFDVRINAEHKLEATARGETVDETRHRLDHEVKAITYHGLTVRRDGPGWMAEVIVDI
ncbi:MAG: archease [Phycisphaerales bacterium]